MILLAIFSFTQSVLTSAKKARLWELIGEGWRRWARRVRQWWDLVGRPQHIVQVDTPPFPLFWILNRNIFKMFCFYSTLSFPFLTLLLLDRWLLLRRGLPDCWPRRTGILIPCRAGFRWGGFWLNPWRGGTGAVGRGKFTLPSFSCGSSDFL